MKLKRMFAAVTFAAAGLAASSSFAAVDQTLEDYQRVGGVSGNLSSVGSEDRKSVV